MAFSRLISNIGQDSFELLQSKTVLIIGIGGVGSFTCEALARCGINNLILVDYDIVDVSNINRQIIALNSTIGRKKVEVMKDRVLDINPNCNVITFHKYYDDDLEKVLFDYKIDFVVDCCDTVIAKYSIINKCLSNQIRFISAMGAANKVKPDKFMISKLEKTSYDPIARILRKMVRDNRIKGEIPVVYSTEKPIKIGLGNKPSSNSFTPSVCGLLLASFVVNTIIEDKYTYK